jgi:hypothetical protein
MFQSLDVLEVGLMYFSSSKLSFMVCLFLLWIMNARHGRETEEKSNSWGLYFYAWIMTSHYRGEAVFSLYLREDEGWEES